MKENIVFLNVDGVLTTKHSLLQAVELMELDPSNKANNISLHPEAQIDEDCLKRLTIILMRGDADIVLTSTWRLYPEMLSALNKAFTRMGVPEPVGSTKDITTPSLQFGERRGFEIKDWLEDEGKLVNRFVIIDNDETYLPDQRPWFIKTTFDLGLEEVHMAQAVMLLRHGSLEIGEDIESCPMCDD